MPTIYKIRVFNTQGLLLRTNMVFNMSPQQANHEAQNTLWNTPDADYYTLETDLD